MKIKLLNMLRWIILLPAAVIGSRLTVVITLLFQRIGNDFPFTDFTEPLASFIPEYVFAPAILISIAGYIAPSHKKAACYVLSVLSSVITLIIIALLTYATYLSNTFNYEYFVCLIGSILMIAIFFITSYHSEE